MTGYKPFSRCVDIICLSTLDPPNLHKWIIDQRLLYLGHKKLIIPDNSQEQVAMGNAIQSFISNTFGKQIIESVLNGNIYVENNTLPLFKKGDILPTLESENKIEKGVYSIWFYSDFTNERITFKWHKYKNYNILKYIVKINQESRFVFELFTENLILRIKPEIIKK